MKNLVQDGAVLPLVAPYDVTSGKGFRVGGVFAVAEHDALSGAAVSGRTEGVFDLLKVGSQAWTAGDKIFWDNTNKYCTKTSTGNQFIGIAMADVASGAGDTTGRVFATPLTGSSLQIRGGVVALDGSNPTSVAHGLTTCVAAAAGLAASAAPGLSTSTVTALINGANLDIYAWKPTGAGDTTLIASTGTENVYWIAIGV